jgi:hypothetical protein
LEYTSSPTSHRHTRDEWTVFKQIGDAFSGVVLTSEEYKRVETPTSRWALSFLREGGLSSLKVAALENHQKQTLDFSNDQALELNHIGKAIRPILREECWCRLEGNEAFLHFTGDYYMYVGVPHHCPKAVALAAELGLHVEECASPVRELAEERIAEDEGDADA